MASGSLIDKLSTAPKWAVITGAVVFVLLLGFVMVYFAFGLGKPKQVAAAEEKGVEIFFPDAVETKNSTSLVEAYRTGVRGEDVLDEPSGAGDYWDMLGEGGLVSSNNEEGPSSGPKKKWRKEELDPNVYSPIEITNIVNGFRTKEEIDEEHRQRDAIFDKAIKNASNALPQQTQAQRDSAYMARMEMAMEMAMKYQQPAGGTIPSDTGDPKPEEEVEPERKIEIESPSVLPTDILADDGIISSLDTPTDNGVIHYDGKRKVKPVKATFLKNEKLTNGQRVIIRLMQDLPLSDGMVIPANTHITGTCNFSRRLKIDVKMLHYGGRMFPTDLSVYDNDGTEGIYCPLVSSDDKKKKKLAQTAGQAVSAAGSIASSLLTGNPFLGSIASSGISAATSSIADDGTVSVNVSSGYEFYIYENVKEDKNEKQGIHY